MSGPGTDRRDSRALEPSLIADATARAEAEARNGLRQYDAGIETVRTALDHGAFRIRPSLILSLHREALRGISSYAGNFRPGGVEISGSKHTPPGAHQVPELVEDLCDDVNEGWDTASPIHSAAYVMWRLNWIHPFADGNGRTSHIVSYVVLSIRAKALLPGTSTIPDQIVDNRGPYFAALDASDAAWAEGRVDVAMMERLLARQLAGFHRQVGGQLS